MSFWKKFPYPKFSSKNADFFFNLTDRKRSFKRRNMIKLIFFLLEMLVYLFSFIIFQQPIVMNPDLFLGEHYVAEFYDCEFKCLDDPT